MIFSLQRFIVWGLESICTLKDAIQYKIDKFLPASFWDKDWRWIGWVFGCNLASLSGELDDKWNTGQWTLG